MTCFSLISSVLCAAAPLTASKISSAAVPLLTPQTAFAPIVHSGCAASTVVDCPEVAEAAYVDKDFAFDGSMSNAVWSAAKPITEFQSRDPQRPMELKSEIRLLYSDSALYVGGVFHQPMASMHAEYDQHDKPIYDDDCLEMLLYVPNADGAVDLFHWAVNPLGAYIDIKNDENTYWTKGIKVKTARAGDRWTLEMRLPFKGIPMSRALPGDFVGVRFCRRVNNPKSTGAFPYLKTTGNNQRANFGKLLFAEFPEASAAQKTAVAAARMARERERYERIVREVVADVAAQQAALAAWEGVEHPVLENARLGVAQMKKALDAYRANKEPLTSETETFLATAAGYRKFVSDNAYVAYPADLWEVGNKRPQLPKSGWGVPPLDFRLAMNERESKCLVFAGVLCGARLDLRIAPKTFSKRRPDRFISADNWEIAEEPYVLLDGDVITAPLIRRDGNIVTLTPGHATRVWITLNSRGLSPCRVPVELELKPANDVSVARRTLMADVTIWKFALPETRDWPIKSFFWGPYQFCNDEVQALKLMHSYHVTHGWTKRFLYQYGLTNETTICEYDKATGRKKVEGLDFNPEVARTGNEEFFRTARDLGMRFVFGWGTPSHPEWFRLMHERLSAMGFKSEDYVFKSLLRDEFKKKHIPMSAAKRAAVDPDRRKHDWWFQAVYLSVPPPVGATMEDIEAAQLPEFYRMWAVIRSMLKNPKHGEDVIRRLKAKGCSVWTYQCSRYMQKRNVLNYYRLYPAEAYVMGLDGAAIWISASRGGSDGFDSQDGYDDGICWYGVDRRMVPTKRFEAFREGLEDVAYLHRLEEAVKAAKDPAAEKIVRARELVKMMRDMVNGVGASLENMAAWRDEAGTLLDSLVK